MKVEKTSGICDNCSADIIYDEKRCNCVYKIIAEKDRYIRICWHCFMNEITPQILHAWGE